MNRPRPIALGGWGCVSRSSWRCRLRAAADEPRDAAPGTDTQGETLFDNTGGGLSGNPGATNALTGTGLLGRLLGFDEESGVRLGGLWIGNTNYLFAGGNDPEDVEFNSVLLIDLALDLEKLVRIPGAQFGVEFLQFNGQPTNDRAGVVAGYNSLTGPPPLVRSQLYELWWRQRLFDDTLILRIGKTVPDQRLQQRAPAARPVRRELLHPGRLGIDLHPDLQEPHPDRRDARVLQLRLRHHGDGRSRV